MQQDSPPTPGTDPQPAPPVPADPAPVTYAPPAPADDSDTDPGLPDFLSRPRRSFWDDDFTL